MAKQTQPTRVAIACQGGGSHTAFTAGVLDAVLEKLDDRFDVVALSGTSGGALCALFAWYGLARKAPEKGRQLLTRFWHDNAAHSLSELLFNDGFVRAARLPVETRVSPYFPGFSWLQQQVATQAGVWERALAFGEHVWGNLPLAACAGTVVREAVAHFATRPEFLDFERLLEAHVPKDGFPKPGVKPRLLVGAVNVLTGSFKAFDSAREAVTPQEILASAAIPTLFQAVRMNGDRYWDGLFSQNPPIKEFVKDVDLADKPDEIWVVQINPRTREDEPRSAADIADRRNELSGNVSLQQEVEAIKTLNKVVAATEALLAAVPEAAASSEAAPLQRYKTVKIRRIEMDEKALVGESLDYASKLDRRPSFLRELQEHGRKQATTFLDNWPSGVRVEV